MDRHKGRELLLADTIAFLQAIGEGLVLAVKLKAPLSPEIVAAARYLRGYHEGPRPTQIEELRRELRTVVEVFGKMQCALRRRQPGDNQIAVDCTTDNDESIMRKAA
ncbi:hypothetical protein AB7783_01650 [Tardiphaga sp. 172_B4_N1_3]|uniref:hypothetical protein n=1 Tax=Tardiphaga sp. 172_B4_N1_3 TaxID=3240787 RepID=UPI003F8CE9CA